MIGLNTLLELHNGAWAILSAFLLFSLSRYMLIEHRLRGLSLRRWLVGLPVSMQLAVGLWVTALGLFVRSTAVWCWRALAGGGAPMPRPYEISLIIGATICCVGILCLIRVTTRPAFGHWLWQGAAACVVLYASASLVI